MISERARRKTMTLIEMNINTLIHKLFPDYSDAFVYSMFITFVMLVLYFVIRNLLKKQVLHTKPLLLKNTNLIAYAVAISLFIYFWVNSPDKENRELQIFADSIVKTIKTFGVDLLSDETDLNFSINASIGNKVDYVFFTLLRICAPILTLRAALSIFKDTFTQLKYFYSFYREVHIFTELNEKSVSVAKDILKNNNNFFSPLIIFENCKKKDEDIDDSLLSEVKKLNAMMTKKHITDFHLTAFRKKSTSVYFIDENDQNNIKNTTTLHERYKNQNFNFYVFTTLSSSEFFIDSIYKENSKISIHLVNQPLIIAYNLMFRKPLFTGADKQNSDKINLLVVGAGRIGMECVKTAMWCGVMQKFSFKIRIVDSVDREPEFYSAYPNFDKDLKNAKINIDKKFIHTDINSTDFIKTLDELNDSNYIIVATGDDELTINTAIKIRTQLVRSSIISNAYSAKNSPVIVPVILNDNYFEVFSQYVRNNKDTDVFYPFGNNSFVFSQSNIKNWIIDDLAKEYHNIYNNLPVNYSSSDYHKAKEKEKRSNRAAAIHTIYKLRDLGIFYCLNDDEKQIQKFIDEKKVRINDIAEIDKIFQSLSDERNYLRYIDTEHKRWTIFSIMDGLSYWSLEQIKNTRLADRAKSNFVPKDGVTNIKIHQLSEGALHGCITETGNLYQLSKTINELKNDTEFTDNFSFPAANYNNKALSMNAKRDAAITGLKLNGFYYNDFKVWWFLRDILSERFDCSILLSHETSANKSLEKTEKNNIKIAFFK